MDVPQFLVGYLLIYGRPADPLDQGYIVQKHFDDIYEQANKTAKIISGLIKYLRTKQTK